MENDNENCTVCTQFKSILKQSKKSSLEKSSAQESVQASAPAMKCPPDADELGSHSWTFLHTMAAYYPCNPDLKSQSIMLDFIKGLSVFYPCHYCASHLQSDLVQHPPNVKSRQEFSEWMCQMHNRVNTRLGKPEFDCSKVFERWKKGNADCL